MIPLRPHGYAVPILHGINTMLLRLIYLLMQCLQWSYPLISHTDVYIDL